MAGVKTMTLTLEKKYERTSTLISLILQIMLSNSEIPNSAFAENKDRIQNIFREMLADFKARISNG